MRNALIVALATSVFAACGGGEDGGDVGEGPGGLTSAGPCVTGTRFVGSEGALMRPGEACIGCHAQQGGEAPVFSIAGTVYPAPHENSDCTGVSGIQVVVTDANGQVLTLTTNSSGNFFSIAAVAMPFQAKVVRGTNERAMGVTQSTGDCNSCHTPAGANGAPGRILAP